MEVFNIYMKMFLSIIYMERYRVKLNLDIKISSKKLYKYFRVSYF